jgi:hypothetical protein
MVFYFLLLAASVYSPLGRETYNMLNIEACNNTGRQKKKNRTRMGRTPNTKTCLWSTGRASGRALMGQVILYNIVNKKIYTKVQK